MVFTYAEAEVVGRNVGDIFVLQGKRVRLTKKTNHAIAVEPYTLLNIIEDWFLEKMGRLLP